MSNPGAIFLCGCKRARNHGYGMTCEQFDEMMIRANGYCEICGKAQEDCSQQRLEVDHDHRLGMGWDHVRGMLCSTCNNHMKFADNGRWEPAPEQRRYVENAWFWVWIPPELRDEPYFPWDWRDDPTPRPAGTPHSRRRAAAIAKAKAERRTLRRTSAGTLIWWK